MKKIKEEKRKEREKKEKEEKDKQQKIREAEKVDILFCQLTSLSNTKNVYWNDALFWGLYKSQ